MPQIRLSYANVVATLCLVGLVGACAIGAFAQSSSRQLAACYKKRGTAKGDMRFLPKASSKCRRTEKKITWNQTGPQGPAGAPGAPGATGERGLQGESGVGSAAPGAVGFFDVDACPAGWSEYVEARGRYIVALPPGGVRGAQVGTPLSAQQNRVVGQHSHGVTDPGHSHGINGSGASLRVPNAVVSFNGRGPITTLPPAPNAFTTGIMPASTGISVQSAGGTAGTNAPYVQLLACRKD
jgi:hypothetical protein